MHKFWSWLGLNLGKHWIVVLTIGAVLTVGSRLRHHQARVLHRPGQLPQQERSGLQGQRRVPAPVRRPGDADARDHGRGSHRERALHAGGVRQWQAVETAAAWKRAHRQRRQPADGARVRRRARCAARRATRPRASPAKSLLGCGRARAKTPDGQAVRNADAAQTLARLNAIPPAQRVLDNPTYADFLIHDNQGNIRKPLPRSSSTTATRRW